MPLSLANSLHNLSSSGILVSLLRNGLMILSLLVQSEIYSFAESFYI